MGLNLYNSDTIRKKCKSLQNKELTNQAHGPIIKLSDGKRIEFSIKIPRAKMKKFFIRRRACPVKIKQKASLGRTLIR